MNVQELRDKGWIIYEVISGSKAYGLDTPESDTDIRGVYIVPTEEILKDSSNFDKHESYLSQVSDDKNDIVFYEVSKFISLLEKGNPNILELLNVSEDCIIYKHPLFDKYFSNNEKYLTKNLQHSFIGYSYTQIKKANGLNKKFKNPQPIERRDILEFCYVLKGAKTIPFWSWYSEIFGDVYEGVFNDKFKAFETIRNWGMVKVPNGDNFYAFYIDSGDLNYRGLIKDLMCTELRLSSVPKMKKEIDTPVNLWFNQNGFVAHCKEHKEYWEWVKKRNPKRFKENIESKTQADLKNLMHCVRLVEVAEDIVNHKEIIVKRPNREFLLSIREGRYSYEEIMSYVEVKVGKLKDLFNSSDLPDCVDKNETRKLLKNIRLENLNK